MRLVAVSAGLGLVALILATSPLGARAAPASAWHAGQYQDSDAPDRPRTRSATSGAARSTGAAIVLAETAVQRPRVSPGERATLRAIYEVKNPSEVRETRVIGYEGLVLARLERVVSRPTGTVQSEYTVNVPRDAAEGWYSVTTIVELSRATTRSGTGGSERRETGFYVGTAGAKEGPLDRPGGGDASVTIKLSANQTRYRVGERVTLSFETNRDAYVTLVNVGTSGEVTILFPNRFSGPHAVKARRMYTVPEPGDGYEFALGGPPGVELVYALVTLKPVRFLPGDFPSGGRVFHSVTEHASAFTRDINVAAKSVPLSEQAKAMIELEVVP